MIRNTPTDEGRAAGARVAALADGREERWRIEMGVVPVRCPSCAFRAGTEANGCMPTIGDALKCATENDRFMCHEFHGWRDGRSVPTTVCAGYLLMRGAVPMAEVPWEFSIGGPDRRKVPR